MQANRASVRWSSVFLFKGVCVMRMQKGSFYFIDDSFYLKHDIDKKLMQNRETVNGQAHERPCYYAFSDAKNPDIFWCIPISSQTDKYHGIVQRKIQKQLDNGKLKPNCNTIRFGDILGREKAFLIQNMFPVTDKYINNRYIDPNTQNPVTIAPTTERDVLNNAREVLKLVERGYSFIVFSDILKTRTDLIAELQHDRVMAVPSASQSDKAQNQPINMKDRMAAAVDEARQRNADTLPAANSPKDPEK